MPTTTPGFDAVFTRQQVMVSHGIQNATVEGRQAGQGD